MKSHASFVAGIAIGVWLMFGGMYAMLHQEFSGLEEAGNAEYGQLKNEIRDDLLMFPLIILVPLTIAAGLTMAVVGYRAQKKTT